MQRLDDDDDTTLTSKHEDHDDENGGGGGTRWRFLEESPRSRTTPNTTTTTTTTMPPTRAVLARTHGTRLGSARPRYAPLPPMITSNVSPSYTPAAPPHLRRPAITLLPSSRPDTNHFARLDPPPAR